MKRKRQKLKLLLFSLLSPLFMLGQQGVSVSGGEGIGEGGSVSYSVGQLVYSNKGDGPSVDEGVQQPLASFPLPVELLYFRAELDEKDQVVLSWETATELENDYFTVDRSNAGREWEEIGKVVGSGTMHEGRKYRTMDESPFGGVSYYRLKQTDKSGGYSYSEIAVIKIQGQGISIYPNPGKDVLVLELGTVPVDDRSYRVLDGMGREISRGRPLDERTEIDISDLLPGVYTLEINQGQLKETKQFIKTN